MRDENQLHAANVELIALDDAEIKYSTVQNWYPGDKDGKGGIYNFVTKRGLCKGKNSKISWFYTVLTERNPHLPPPQNIVSSWPYETVRQRHWKHREYLPASSDPTSIGNRTANSWR